MKTHHRRKKNGARRMSYKAVCWELQEKLLLLQHQHREQLQARSSLANKSLLLNGWMHCLDLLSDAGPSGGSENADILQELLQELQQQLGMQQGVPGATTAAAPDAEGTASLLLPIAPREDPSAYFRDLISRPVAPGVESLTPEQHLLQHRDLALNLSLQLHLLGGNASARGTSAVGVIKKRLDSHFHLLWSLVYCGKLHIADSAKTFNLETKQSLAPGSPLVDNQKSIKSVVLPMLQLSPQQEDDIASAMELCESLMEPISQEIQQLQQQLDDCVKRSSSSLGLAANDSTSTSSGVAGSTAPPTRSAALLEEQQQLLSRLNLVLKKQYFVVAATTATFLGTLTWLQVAKMVVHRWPYTASLQYVAKAIWQQRNERLQHEAAAAAALH